MENAVLGFSAGILCTISFVPQVVKLYRSKKTEDISLATFSLFSLGLILWLIYGVQLHSWPIILANTVTLILTVLIITFKIKY